jgi:prolipoprotein diacylglyceryltransferase
MHHDAVWYGIVIATGLAFATVIAALVWLYFNATTKKSGDK